MSVLFIARSSASRLTNISVGILSVPIPVTVCSSLRCIHCSASSQNFWEPDRKGGYKTKIIKPTPVLVREGLSQVKGEVAKFKEEVITTLRCDHLTDLYHNDYEVVWKFDKKETVDSWIVTSDSDHNEGMSRAEFVLGANQKSIFKGVINTDVPKDGIIKNAGYCNIRSPQNMISFKRPRPYDWSIFTHLITKVRGDGRTYQLILQMDRYFDVQWNDQYNYPLFTRGGPYWQIAKIPFSKFFLSAKGRVQDKQGPIQLDRIRSLGVTLSDGNPGPFQLEIDFIGLLYDETHKHTFEYEMYPVSTAVFC